MTWSCILGIDPGLDGAFALIDNQGRMVEILDTPTLVVKQKPLRRDYDEHVIGSWLRKAAPQISMAGIERLGAFPGTSPRQTPGSIATSNFRLGLSLGMLRGQLAALAIPFDLIAPQTWKSALMKGMPKEKAASILRAKQLCPDAAEHLTLKKHDGRADALLIAQYVLRFRRGEL